MRERIMQQKENQVFYVQSPGLTRWTTERRYQLRSAEVDSVDCPNIINSTMCNGNVNCSMQLVNWTRSSLELVQPVDLNGLAISDAWVWWHEGLVILEVSGARV